MPAGRCCWKAGSTGSRCRLSPKDMDFVEAKAGAAREIALAFGVPPLLLGLPGDNTHANYAEANRAFYRQTVMPLVRRTGEALAHWLAPAFGEMLRSNRTSTPSRRSPTSANPSGGACPPPAS